MNSPLCESQSVIESFFIFQRRPILSKPSPFHRCSVQPSPAQPNCLTHQTVHTITRLRIWIGDCLQLHQRLVFYTTMYSIHTEENIGQHKPNTHSDGFTFILCSKIQPICHNFQNFYYFLLHHLSTIFCFITITKLPSKKDNGL